MGYSFPPKQSSTSNVTVVGDQVGLLKDSITNPLGGQKVTRIGVWEDVNGDTRYMKYYNGNDLLFTVTFDNAQESLSETWSMMRT